MAVCDAGQQPAANRHIDGADGLDRAVQRGFAVVASEVRNLAQRSADVAKVIKSLIGSSVETVEAGSRRVGDAGASMEDIVAKVKRVSVLIGEIRASTIEQTSGTGQVSAAVTQLDHSTQQNAALVEQSAAAPSGQEGRSHCG